MAAHAVAPAFAAPVMFNNDMLLTVFEFCDQRSTALFAFTCRRIRSVYTGSLLMWWRRFLESLVWRDVRKYDTRCRLCPAQLSELYNPVSACLHIPGIGFDMDCSTCFARDDPDMGYCADCTHDDPISGDSCCTICLDRTKAAVLIVQRQWRRLATPAVTSIVARLDIVVVVNIASFLDYFDFELLRMTCHGFRAVAYPRHLRVKSATARIHLFWWDTCYGTCDQCGHLMVDAHALDPRNFCIACSATFCKNCSGNLRNHRGHINSYCAECFDSDADTDGEVGRDCGSCASDSDSDTSSDTTVDIPVHCSDPEVIDI